MRIIFQTKTVFWKEALRTYKHSCTKDAVMVRRMDPEAEMS